MKQKLKDNLETIVAFGVVVAMVISAMTFFATKSEVGAVEFQIVMNTTQDQLDRTNDAIIRTDQQLMWLERKAAAAGEDCKLNPRWRELRVELDRLKAQQGTLYKRIADQTKKDKK